MLFVILVNSNLIVLCYTTIIIERPPFTTVEDWLAIILRPSSRMSITNNIRNFVTTFLLGCAVLQLRLSPVLGRQSPTTSSGGQHVLDIKVLSSRSNLTVFVNSELVLSSQSDGSMEGETDTAGLYLVVLSQHTGAVLMQRRFETTKYAEGLALYPVISSVASGRILIFAVKTDAAQNLAQVSRELLSQLGLGSARYVSYRGYITGVLEADGPTLGDAVVLDPEPQYRGTYAAPVWAHVQLQLQEAEHCVWMTGAAHSARRLFCGAYDGYGDLCDCSSPAPLIEPELQLQDSAIVDVPVLVMAGNRPTELYRCLRLLLGQPGGSRDRLLVAVEGEHEEVMQLLHLLQIRYVINREFDSDEQEAPQSGYPNQKRNLYISKKITSHYRLSLEMIFTLFPAAPAVIIMEEDLLASPDFFSFFNQTAWLLEADPSLYCISAWNDLGAMHTFREVTKLFRVETMVGVGWMLSRAVYEEVMHKWMALKNLEFDWDVYLRLNINAGQRECVVPQVSRVFHFGLTGAHVKGVLTQAHFAGHLASTRPGILLEGVHRMIQHEYEREIYSILNDFDTVFLNSSLSPCHLKFLPKDFEGSTVVIFFQMVQDQDVSAWKRLAACLGLFHVDTRGHHRGLFRFNFYRTSVMAIGYPYSDYSHFWPPNGKMILPIESRKTEEKMDDLAVKNRIRHRVPDLEPFAPGLMIQDKATVLY